MINTNGCSRNRSLSKTTSNDITNFEYNRANRLTRISNNGTEASYYYDPFGRRIAKEVNGKRTWFHYSAEGLVAEFEAEGKLTTSYSYEPDSLYSTDPVMMGQAGNHYFYHNDHLGAPQKLTELGGKTVWQASYDAFGVVTIKKDLVSNNFRFPGQYYDAETGLYYNWHRYYDPENGRYITADPIGLAGGMNLYAYVAGDPVNWIDPWSLAQFGYRPLDSLGFIPPYGTNAFDDRHNTEWVHEQLWFDDTAENPNLRTNIGFFGDNGMWNEPGTVREDTGHIRDDYTFRGPIYDDDVMRRALRYLEGPWGGSNYNVVLENNCQDFSDALRQTYFRLGGTVTWPTS